MTRRPEISAVATQGEGVATAEAHGTAAGEKRHRKAVEPLCDACRKWRSDYDRDYSRLRRMNPTSRAKQADIFADWQRRNREHRNAYARKRARELRRRAEFDRRRGVDLVVVDRLIAGDAVPHNRAERLEAVRRLRDRGVTYLDIAARLRIQHRQVHRDIAELGLVERRETVA